MKSNVTFSVETEVVLELDKRKGNKSALVEQLLRQYLELPEFQPTDEIELNAEEFRVKCRLAEIEAKRKDMAKEAAKKLKEPPIIDDGGS